MAKVAKQFVRLALFVTVAALLSACSILDVINLLPVTPGATVEQAISYGDHSRKKLDVYRPINPTSSSAIIVYFYGGGWHQGDRGLYRFLGHKLASMGHYAVIPDYRLFPEAVFPSFVEDGAEAVNYVLDNLNTIANQDRPVFLMGHSAGAHISAMITLDPRFLENVGHRTDELAGFIGLAGAYDFLPITSKKTGAAFPDKTNRKQSQPITFIDETDPPLFLAHGDKDKRVWLKNSLNLANRTKDFSIPATLKVYPEVGHADILRPFVPFMGDDHGLLSAISDFVYRHSK